MTWPFKRKASLLIVIVVFAFAGCGSQTPTTVSEPAPNPSITQPSTPTPEPAIAAPNEPAPTPSITQPDTIPAANASAGNPSQDVCGGGIADMDSDNDGTPDCTDQCINDPLKTKPGICGCDVSDVDPATWYTDADGDGFGDPNRSSISCSRPQGSVSDNSDCNDANASINSRAFEICDGFNNDCDSGTDEGIPGCIGGHIEGLPPDPATVASPVDQTIATDFHSTTSFLYTGDEPIQTGVPEGTINEEKAAIVRGRVVMRDGAPFPGVLMSISGHPEYGTTKSREDGVFDLAVNGSTTDVVVRYEFEGYLSVERRVIAQALDYAWVKDVVMMPIDANANAIDLTAPDAIKIAEGSEVSDEDGTRKAVVLFPAGTSAQIALQDGTMQEIENMTVRITEFTVGATGPNAMPAELPPTSAYTYAADFTVDEAIAAGAKEVIFDRPVIFYLENFLNFPAGFPIPLGYYDTEKAAWIASDNGIVIKILDIVSGRAVLSLDENDALASTEALSNLGMTDAELASIASRYARGQTLWRMPLPHFTSWDANVGLWPPDDAVYADVADPVSASDLLDDPCYASGSIIGCENQTLGEKIDIVGSDFGLYYTSARSPGRAASNSIDIPVSGDALPSNLKRIDLEISVAGQRIAESLAAVSNQTYRFAWNGRDGYGRTINGRQPIKVRIGYVYGAVYQQVQRFGYNGDGMVTMSPSREDITLWKEWTGSVGSWQNGSDGIGGLSLGVHHAYDPFGRTLYLGDGTHREAAQRNNIIKTIPGGEPASRDVPSVIAVDHLDNVYISTPHYHMVWKIDKEGNVSRFAGNPSRFLGNYIPGFWGDGGPASMAGLNYPSSLAADAQGNVYIVDSGNNRIRRVDTNGIITTIAGRGTEWCGERCIGGNSGYSGNGGPATDALMYKPVTMAFDREGNIYVVDQTLGRLDSQGNSGVWPVVRKIGLDGIISTVAGGESGDYGYDGTYPARNVKLCSPDGIDVDTAGNIFIAERICNRVRKITPQGQIMVVAGGGANATDEDIPATDAKLKGPSDVAVDNDGGILVSENSGWRIRKLGSDGHIITIAGTGVQRFRGDGGPALDADFSGLSQIAVDEKGAIYVIDGFADRVRKISPMFPGIGRDDIIIVSEDGNELYHFDRFGRHLDTKNTLTGGPIYTFGYDDKGLLSAITDASGKVTNIERNANGTPLAIVASFGPRTTLVLDDNGYLKSVTDPSGGTTELDYWAGGLLSRFTDPNGHASTFTYDPLGLLTRDTDAAGGFKTLTKVTDAAGSTVTVLTALGRNDFYRVERQPTGTMRRVVTDTAGFFAETNITAGGDRVIAYADGTMVTEDTGPDPRFGMQSPILESKTTITPDGLQSVVNFSRQIALADSQDLLSLLGQTDILTVNGRVYQNNFTVANGALTAQSPTGRVVRSVIDSAGRITMRETSGIAAISFAYNGAGMLSITSQGGRNLSISYNTDGLPDTITDAIGRTTSFGYDAAGHPVVKVFPDGRDIRYSYDANGNLISITPPGRPVHSFGYSAVDLETFYDPPNIGFSSDETQYTYDLDRRLRRITRPDGQSVVFDYDAGGRTYSMTFPEGVILYDYDANTGNLSTITGPGDADVTFTYDGSLPLSTAWLGTVGGTVSRTFDNNFWITEMRVNGRNAVGFIYDDDGLLITAGSISIVHDAANGLVTGATLGNTTTTTSYNEFGEVSLESASFASGVVYAESFTRDALGRITDRTETAGSSQKRYSYTYDLGGRLVSASVEGQVTTYTYDPNGNRISKEDTNGRTEASYDSQDRLLSYGSNAYIYTANGDLLTKSSPYGATSYSYDVLGNLRSLTLPNGTAIEYVIDGQNRRVGKKVNSVLVGGWLYANQLNPVAELDGNGDVVSTFIYATKPNVPDYMVRGGITYRIISDHLGSVRMVVSSATGEIAQRMDYDEFGIVTLDTNPAFQPFGFAGGLYDHQTHLVRFGARDYDAETGRWTSKDPILFSGGDTNLYGYVMNDPVNYRDSLGLSSLTYNSGTGTLTLYDNSGNRVGQYPAGNNAQSGSRGAWQPGTYDYSYHTTHPDDSPDSSYGSNGNFVFDVPGCIGCGIHSGRENTPDLRGRAGPQHATNGCIRTTDAATSQMSQINSNGDPITTLIVQ